MFKGIPNPLWISGFTSGDGSFHIVTRNSKLSGSTTRSVFARSSIHLHIRELEVLKGIATYFRLYSSQHVVTSDTKVVLNLVTENAKKK